MAVGTWNIFVQTIFVYQLVILKNWNKNNLMIEAPQQPLVFEIQITGPASSTYFYPF